MSLAVTWALRVTASETIMAQYWFNKVYALFSDSRRSLLVFLSLSLLVVSPSCIGSSPDTTTTSVSTKDNQPPVVTSAKIVTDSISLDRLVEVQVDAQDPEREAVSFLYQWYVDGTALAKQTGATLPAEVLTQGQSVSVEIIPMDGSNKGQPYRTKSVRVGNTPPKVTTVSLRPQTVRPGVRVEAQVETNDPDHDMVDIIYKWYRNEAVVKEGEESFLDTTGFAARDVITVEATARDATTFGDIRKSEPLVLGNSAPHIVSSPPIGVSQDRFDYSVRAVDPDGDRLSYQLEVSPPGMTIGAESGHIVWQIPPDQRGTFHVKVAARDGAGGLATQEFDVTLTLADPAKPSGA